MNKRILLINPNRYAEPPVIPVGLEYVGSYLEQAGFDVRMLDLCFADEPEAAVRRAARECGPALIGITIRNIDSALFNNNIFFLPGIKKIIDAAKESGAPVALGGVGYTSAPEIILKETGADYGVAGPGELAFAQLAGDICGGRTPKSGVISGWDAGIDPDFTPERPFGIDYAKYIEKGGIAGFATQYGCCERCDYCIEAATPVSHRNPAAVISELAALTRMGFSDFHLCDSEYNLDLSFSERFAAALADATLPLKWSLYIKPVPWSEKMFSELKLSGATAITMSVDSFALSGELPRYGFDDLAAITGICRRLGIKLAVDLLTGRPGEPLDSTAAAIDFFKTNRPDAVGVNAYFRVYPGTGFQQTIGRIAADSLIHTASGCGSALEPVFYNHLSIESLKDIIGGDELFKIEGFERSSNYERLQGKSRD
ncbi:MAG: cobalamin-dependent protein [bacterium]